MGGVEKIKLSDGALMPIKKDFWYPYHRRMMEVTDCVDVMASFKNQMDYENAFIDFVKQLENAYTSFYEMLKTKTTKAQPRMGEIEVFRKKDELLKYLKQARHISQHRILTLDWGEGKTTIGEGFYGRIRSLYVYPNGEFRWEGEGFPGVKKLELVHHPGKPKLPTIENQGDTYQRPNYHLGQEIINFPPHEVAKLAFEFYKTRLGQ